MKCPVCSKIFEEFPEYCDSCGWDFPIYASIDKEIEIMLEKRIKLCQTNWKTAKEINSKFELCNKDYIRLKEAHKSLEIESKKQESILKDYDRIKKENENLKEKMRNYHYLGQFPNLMDKDLGQEEKFLKVKAENEFLKFECDSLVSIGIQLVLNETIPDPNSFDPGSITYYREISSTYTRLDLTSLNIKKGSYYITINLINSLEKSPYYYRIEKKQLIRKVKI